MTNPNRSELLEAMAEFGELFPDLRFGQAIANLVTTAKGPGTLTEWGEAVWDIEDDELLAELQESIACRREAMAGSSEGKPRLATELPTGEGRTPENVRRTWISLLESMVHFAEENSSVIATDLDQDVLNAIRPLVAREKTLRRLAPMSMR
jgi:hypothetical protein